MQFLQNWTAINTSEYKDKISLLHTSVYGWSWIDFYSDFNSYQKLMIVFFFDLAGRRYDFSAHFRLAQSTPAGQKHKIKVTLKYKLSNGKGYSYIRIAEADGVTSGGWTKASGCLNMPRTTPDVLLEEATLYFEGPPPDISYMAAETSLVDSTPASGE